MVKKLCIIAAMSLALAACSTQTFNMGRINSTAPKTDNMQSFFVSGIGQEQTINAAEVCGGATKVAKVQVQQTFLNIVLTTVTGGIYSPRQARVFCTR